MDHITPVKVPISKASPNFRSINCNSKNLPSHAQLTRKNILQSDCKPLSMFYTQMNQAHVTLFLVHT